MIRSLVIASGFLVVGLMAGAVSSSAARAQQPVPPATSPGEIVAMQLYARGIRIEDAVIAYIVEIVRRTRDDASIELGASPRASIALLKAAQVIAAASGRGFVTPDDVKPMAMAVLRHRVILHPDAQLQGVTADERIAEILRAVPVPRLAS